MAPVGRAAIRRHSSSRTPGAAPSRRMRPCEAVELSSRARMPTAAAARSEAPPTEAAARDSAEAAADAATSAAIFPIIRHLADSIPANRRHATDSMRFRADPQSVAARRHACPALRRATSSRQFPWRQGRPAGKSAEASEPVAPRKPARSRRPWLQARSTRSTRGQEAAGGSERRRPAPPAKTTRGDNDAGFASLDGKVDALAAETRADATRRQAPSPGKAARNRRRSSRQASHPQLVRRRRRATTCAASGETPERQATVLSSESVVRSSERTSAAENHVLVPSHQPKRLAKAKPQTRECNAKQDRHDAAQASGDVRENA